MRLAQGVHTALDELRMQMLGAQVLFGFQFQGVFQEGFDGISGKARLADLVGFAFITVTLGLLLAPCAQHRLVEKGRATHRIFAAAGHFAEAALATYALAIGFDVFAVSESTLGAEFAFVAAMSAAIIALLFWYALGLVLARMVKTERTVMPASEEPELHEKIDQMLTEARVILPGAQALLGFQFIVTMTQAFPKLPDIVKHVHFLALGMVLLAIMLLLAPAAVHRLTFRGQDSARMHSIGSILVTAALVPLAAGIAADVYVALAKAAPGLAPWIGSAASFMLLIGFWYAVPLALRLRHAESS